MKILKSRTTTVLLAAVLLVGGLNVAAYAATGGNFLLGRANSATRTSTLSNIGFGPALSLQSRSNTPPLAVNSTKRVAKLNADMVDGKHASSFQPKIGAPVWHNLTLATGVSGACYTGTPQYMVQFGIVYFRGDLCGTSSDLAQGQQVFTMPAGTHPTRSTSGSFLYMTVDECGGETGRIYMEASSGKVWLQLDGANTSGTTCFASLEGVSYAL